MMIYIDDLVNGERRRELLEILPILYALEKFETRRQVSEFLGITSKSLRNRILRYEDLKEHRLGLQPCKGYDYDGKRLPRPDDL